jgi:hypothetical protein
MMLHRIVCAAGLLFMLIAPGQAQSVFKQPIGAKVSGSFEIGQARLPLPEGEWTVLGKMEERSYGGPSGVIIQRVFLAQFQNGALSRAVLASSNEEGVRFGWKRNTNCDRVDMHFVSADKNYDVQNQQCWWVNHVTTAVGNSTWKSITDAYAYMDKNNIRRPSTVVGVFYSLVRGSNFVDAIYWFNPESDGFEPPKTIDWRNNDWHKSRIVGDPKKGAYIDRLKTWGTSTLPRVQAAFGG